MPTLTKKAQAEIARLRTLFPREIQVSIHRSQDGGFVASIPDYPGLLTQAETLSELCDMVNDVMRIYFNVPQKHASYMPTYLPPVQVAQQLDAYPVRTVERDVTFTLPSRAKAHR